MEWLFVLKDRYTTNAGYWLKITNLDDYFKYMELVNTNRYQKVFENYLYGKEYGGITNEHGPHMKEAALTNLIVLEASNQNEKNGTNFNILDAISNFSNRVMDTQIELLKSTGALYFNRSGGYHCYDPDSKENGFVRRKELIWPDFKKDEIRIKSFPGGEHFYAYIDDMQVRDGDTLKWNTYDEAYKQALSMLDNCN